MSHFPKNHPLRPLYRVLGFAAGAYCLVFGILGVATVSGALFARGHDRVLGLQINLAFAVASIVVGAIIVVTAVIGRNVDRGVNLILGPLFLVVGLAMMGLMQTGANFLDFGMSTCIVSFVIGLVLLAGAFYGETASPEQARAEEAFRRSAPDPESQLQPHP
jgi:hypothetical protein